VLSKVAALQMLQLQMSTFSASFLTGQQFRQKINKKVKIA